MKKENKVKKMIDLVLLYILLFILGIWIGTGISYHNKAIDYFIAAKHLAYHHLEQVGCDAIVGGKAD